MTNEQILKQVIEKAVKNGWSYFSDGSLVDYDDLKSLVKSEQYRDIYCWGHIIFSHDFAKAFWGEEYVNRELRLNMEDCPAWRHHLQAMVLEKEPLQYLKKFL